MTRVVVLLVCSACTTTQSARPVAPNTVEISVGLGRAAQFDEDIAEGDWLGDLMVRFGITDGADFGIHALHTPGAGGPGAVAIDPKFRIGENGRSMLSLGVPVGYVWGDGADGDLRGGFAVPALYLGIQLSETLEFVSSVRYMLTLADDPSMTDKVMKGFGASFAPRFIDGQHSIAVAPEIGFMRVDDQSFLTFGLSVGVGH